jgi:hypothetical protein
VGFVFLADCRGGGRILQLPVPPCHSQVASWSEAIGNSRGHELQTPFFFFFLFFFSFRFFLFLLLFFRL